MITGTIFQFFAGGIGRWLGTLAVVGVALLSWRVSDVSNQRAIGEAKAMAKVQEATRHVARKANAAVTRSRDERVRGTIDPTTRFD
jgi:hypothetical protein